MTVEDPATLDRCTAVWAVVTYVIADMQEMLPREGAYPSSEPTEPSTGTATVTLSSIITWAISLILIVYQG